MRSQGKMSGKLGNGLSGWFQSFIFLHIFYHGSLMKLNINYSMMNDVWNEHGVNDVFFIFCSQEHGAMLCLFVSFFLCVCNSVFILLLREEHMFQSPKGKFRNEEITFFSFSFSFLVSTHEKNFTYGLPRMEALVRIANIPIVESGVKTAGRVYFDLKVKFIHTISLRSRIISHTLIHCFFL